MKKAWNAFLATRSEEDFEILFNEAGAFVYTICRRYLPNHEEAGEAFQLTWVRLLEESARGTLSKDEPRTVIGRLAAREADAYLKRQLRRLRKESPVEELFGVSDESPSPAETAREKELRARLEALLYQLPEKLRLPAMLHYLDGMTQQEVAEVLGIPRPTVATRLRTALKKLQPMARKAGLQEALEILVAGGVVGGLLAPPATTSAMHVYTAWKAGTVALPALESGGVLGSALVAKLVVGIAVIAVVAGVFLQNQRTGQSARKSSGVALIGTTQTDAPSSAGMNSGSLNDSPQDTSQAGGVTTQLAHAEASSSSASVQAISAELTWTGTQTPVVSADVSLMVGNAAVTRVTTGADGRFTLRAPETWKVRALRITHPDMIGTEKEFDYDSDRDAQVLQIDRKASVGGSVHRMDTGALIPGAEVMLAGTDLRATADEKGRFRLDGIPPGVYTMSASSGNLVTSTKPGSGTKLVLAANDLRTSVTLSLKPLGSVGVLVLDKATGEPIANAEVHCMKGPRLRTNANGSVLMKDMKPGSYSVEVLGEGYAQEEKELVLGEDRDALLVYELIPGGSVYGIVRDVAGNPIEGVGLGGYYRGPTCFGNWGRTDANGHYEVSHFERGRTVYQLWFSKSGYARGGGIDKVMIPLDAQRVEYNVTLKPGAQFAGTVVDETDNPIAGALIDYGEQFHSEKAMYTTDATGTFEFSGVDPNSAYLMVRAKRFAAQVVNLNPNDASEVRVVMHPEHWLKGTVQDIDGNPIMGARIYIRVFDRHSMSEPLATDEAGRFHADGLPSEVKLSIRQNGYSGEEIETSDLDRADLVVTLRPEGVLRGRVVDAKTGEPVPHFNVRLGFAGQEEATDRPCSINTSQIDYGLDFDNPDGSFEIPKLVEGSALSLRIAAAGYLTYAVDRVLVHAEPEIQEVVAQLKTRGEGQHGIVVDASGAPIADARVTLLAYRKKSPYQISYFSWLDYARYQRDCVSFQRVSTDQNGRFELEDFAANGPFQMLAEKDGYGRQKLQFDEWREDETRVVLKPAARLHGRINPEIVTGEVRLQFDRIGETLHSVPVTTSTEEYSIENLAEGTYILSLLAPSTGVWKQLFSESVELTAGEDRTLDVGFETKRTIMGVVRRVGAPVPGFNVLLCRREGNTARLIDSTLTDGDGRYSLATTESDVLIVPIGSAPETLAAHFAGGRDLSITEENVTCDFDVVYTGAVKGRIVSSPVRYQGNDTTLTICLELEGGGYSSFGWLGTDKDGRFYVPGLEKGAYALMAPNSAGSMEIITRQIQVPADGTDIELGDLTIP